MGVNGFLARYDTFDKEKVDFLYKPLTDGNYYKATDPDNSVLLMWLTGKKSPVMPIGKGPDETINAKVYAWIKQGAKNN
jgi:hypothetical protein